jgi:hypothetical protein
MHGVIPRPGVLGEIPRLRWAMVWVMDLKLSEVTNVLISNEH